MESSVQHSSVQHSSGSSQAACLVLRGVRACAPSDLRHAYHTHGEASLPASSMNCGVKRRPVRVKPSGGLLAARRRRKRQGCVLGLLEAHTRTSLARNCHIESLPLAAFQLIPP